MLYNLSVVLFASALLKNNERYLQTLSAIQKALSAAPNDAFKAWMLGRVVLAATYMNDNTTVDVLLPVLKDHLTNVEKNECYARALGYLAAVNPEEYKANHSAMLSAASALTKPADALWSHVMNLQAAAKAKDSETFTNILQQMQALTKQDTVADALAKIPTDDWRAWALGITLEAAATIGDKDLYDQLSQPIAKAIIEAVKSNLDANAMLAQISTTSATTLMIEKSPRATL